MLQCMIDAMEGQEVETADIPGAFMQTDYDKGDIQIKLEGDMVTLLEQVDPECYKYFIYTDKLGRKCMYAEAKEGIYVTLEESFQLQMGFHSYVLTIYVRLYRIIEALHGSQFC